MAEFTFAACYCGCYATRLQLLNATIFDGAPQSLNLLTSPAAFWQCMVDEKPEWVMVTSYQLEREPKFLNILREEHRSVSIILCVMPNSPSSDLLWPMLRQLEPDILCTLAELAACLAALKAKQHYHSCLVAVFSQLANVLPNNISYQQIPPPPPPRKASRANRFRSTNFTGNAQWVVSPANCGGLVYQPAHGR